MLQLIVTHTRYDEYNPSMEGAAIYEERLWVMVKRKFPTLKIPKNVNNANENEKDQLNLLRKLQSIHDNSLISEWEERFKELAESWNLIYTAKQF